MLVPFLVVLCVVSVLSLLLIILFGSWMPDFITEICSGGRVEPKVMVIRAILLLGLVWGIFYAVGSCVP
jgi:hypothetical protein